MLRAFKLKLFLVFAIFFGTGINSKPVVFNDLTILVSSCDKYSSLWDPFFVSLFKQWPSLMRENNNVPIILIANNKKFSNPRVKTFNIPNEISWSDNMIDALNQVQTKYVLIALDDYWITDPVDEQRLQELYTLMQKEDAAMINISVNDHRWQAGVKHPTVSNVMYVDKFKHYKANLQLAIWDKEVLKYLLRPGESAWAFELEGTARSHGYPKIFLGLYDEEPITHLNASDQGYIRPKAIAFAQQQQIPFSPELPISDKNKYKLSYKLWKGRFNKLFSILKNPKAYFESQYPYHVEVKK